MREFLFQFGARVWRSSLMFGAFATALRVGAQIILLPAILLYLSTAEQATWWVFVALGNFASLADFGFGQSISRVYSYMWAGADEFQAEGLRPLNEAKGPNLAAIARFHHSVQYFYWCFALGATVILALAGTVYLSKAVADTGGIGRIWLLWALYLVVIGFNFGTSFWLLACQGVNRVRDVQVAYVVSSIVFLVVIVVLLKLGCGLVAMVAGSFFRGLVIRGMGIVAFRRAVPPLAELGKPDFSILRRIWPNARKFGVLSIAGYLQSNGNILLSRCFLGEGITATMGVTVQAGNLLVGFSSLWLNVKWPQISVLRTQGKLPEMSLLFARRFALSLITFVTCAIIVASAGDRLLEWKHSPTRLIALPYLVVYFLYLLQQLIYVQFANLVFTENVVPFCAISLLTGGAMVVLSLILTPLLGLWGLILAPLLAEMSLSAWVVVRRGFHGQPLAFKQFCRAAALGRL